MMGGASGGFSDRRQARHGRASSSSSWSSLEELSSASASFSSAQAFQLRSAAQVAGWSRHARRYDFGCALGWSRPLLLDHGGLAASEQAQLDALAAHAAPARSTTEKARHCTARRRTPAPAPPTPVTVDPPCRRSPVRLACPRKQSLMRRGSPPSTLYTVTGCDWHRSPPAHHSLAARHHNTAGTVCPPTILARRAQFAQWRCATQQKALLQPTGRPLAGPQLFRPTIRPCSYNFGVSVTVVGIASTSPPPPSPLPPLAPARARRAGPWAASLDRPLSPAPAPPAPPARPAALCPAVTRIPRRALRAGRGGVQR